MKTGKYILLLITLLCTLSCVKEDELGPGGSVRGGIVLTLDSSSALRLQTRATDLQEGSCFSNVLVVLVDNSNNVVSKVYKEYPYDPSASGNDTHQDEIVGSTATQDIIRFSGLLPGNYTVYAYANIDAADWQNSGTDLISDASKEKGVTTSTSFSAFVDRELKSMVSSTDVPSNPATCMLLTGKMNIAVGLSTANATLDLKRPVVRFKVTVCNHTSYPVRINELRFSHFNPDRAYILDHHNASGVPSLPSNVNYRAMPAFDTSDGDDDEVAANADEIIYQRLMYENAYSGPYKIYAALTLDRSSESSPNLELSLGDNPFGVIDYETLNQMDEGEQVNVLVVNPQISRVSGRIFAYISADNYMAWESAGYDNYSAYYARAKAIYDEDASFTYSGYSDSSSDGYSAWDGISANAPKENNSFSYTGKRSSYFHTISKSGGLFTIDGLAINGANTGTVTGTSISNLRIEKGTVKSGKNPSDADGKLVRFINNSNDWYLKANTNWENGKPKKKESNLRFESGGDTNQDRQFMLFGKYMSGGLMKRILKENNKAIPLTYMARNEEINVIINVYYAAQAGVLDFEVDNSTWKTPTTSSHTFE